MEPCYSLSSSDLDGDTEEIIELGNRCEEVGLNDVDNMCEENNQVQDDEIEVVSFTDELESKLEMGTHMNSIEDAYVIYCEYARIKGFSVKKGDNGYFPRSSELQSKEFECSCQGSKDHKASKEKVPVYQKPTIRTNCKARLRISKEKGGAWKVSRFIKEHNHEFVSSAQSHTLRSARHMSHAKKSTLETLVKAGISVSNAISFMQNEAHGARNLGFIRKDAYNHIDFLKRHTKVDNGDANSLVQYFTKKSNKEAGFYWSMQLDDDDQIMNFFFRDHRSFIDYECFGDVLSIDTTYKTNKYDLICAPFVGINHHMKNVMFGLAFMSDEIESSFEWLFQTFLDSMHGKQPQVVFSDQCQAMMNAIESIFPHSHHRLCQWHINQNAPSHFGSLNGNSSFKSLWQKCMNRCDSESEFDETWDHMILQYNLVDHAWLNGMYKLRRKWATCFSNDLFCAGLLATPRSEATNRVLKDVGKRTFTLFEFVENYENIQKRWRSNEEDENTRCQGIAGQILQCNPLLSSAAIVYTLNVYKKFENEFLQCLNIVFVGQSDMGNGQFDFRLRSQGENSRIRRVLFDKETHEVKCSCHHFETVGILCRHALRVFNLMNVTILPRSCILQRWLKTAVERVVTEAENRGFGGDYESDLVFVNQTMRTSYDLAHLCKSHQGARSKLTGMLDSVKNELTTFFERLSTDDRGDDANVQRGNEAAIRGHIRNPLTARARGLTKTRITRHWDDNSRKSKGRGKGKGKAECSSARGSKRKVQSSQDGTHPQQSNYVQPPVCSSFQITQDLQQQSTLLPPHYQFMPQFSSQIDPNQWSSQASGNPSSSDPNNLFGYIFGSSRRI